MVEVIDFGIRDYGEILHQQENLFHTLIEEKKEGIKGKEYILIGEHAPVLTMGRRAKSSNILISDEILKKKRIGLYQIGRGGDVTYHCPGQITVYPILDLDRHGLGVKDYVALMEEAVIILLQKYGIKGERVEGATGVWIGKGTSVERKICAIGIKCNRFCTMHGFALNVNNSLEGFTFINPCGFKDKGVTSMQEELQNGDAVENKQLPDIEKIKRELLHIFLSLIFPLEEILNLPE
ncbi:MAG: lipoyl(octanoyl) transferase LipB [Muribaculaceae bacterium]|nr:lipoyl(octanoyl) transferase LipB [Muribaculaceae bacterium]